MTNLEALRAAVIYPLSSDNLLIKTLLDRGVDKDSDYSADNKKDVELAQADCFASMIATPHIVEGGYQLSLTDKSNLIKVASGIYDKYGELNPLKEKVVINDRTNRW